MGNLLHHNHRPHLLHRRHRPSEQEDTNNKGIGDLGDLGLVSGRHETAPVMTSISHHSLGMPHASFIESSRLCNFNNCRCICPQFSVRYGHSIEDHGPWACQFDMVSDPMAAQSNHGDHRQSMGITYTS